MSEQCIFCRIVKGDLPCTKIYEDDRCLCFLDIGPIVKGHVLVIPKQHFATISDTPAEVLQNLIVLVRHVGAALMQGLAADGLNIAQANGAAAGQEVPHIHFHVIPRFETDGHSWNWNAKRYDSAEEAQGIADSIRKGLTGIAHHKQD